MKKVFMSFAVVAMMVAVSACGNNKKAQAAEENAEAVEVVEETACTECTDSTCTECADSTCTECPAAQAE